MTDRQTVPWPYRALLLVVVTSCEEEGNGRNKGHKHESFLEAKFRCVLDHQFCPVGVSFFDTLEEASRKVSWGFFECV